MRPFISNPICLSAADPRHGAAVSLGYAERMYRIGLDSYTSYQYPYRDNTPDIVLLTPKNPLIFTHISSELLTVRSVSGGVPLRPVNGGG